MSIQLLAGILPIAYLIFSKKKFYFPFILYLVLSSITTISLILTIKLSIHNYWIIMLYHFTSFLCLMFYFHQTITIKPNFPLIFSFLFIPVFIVDIFFNSSYLYFFWNFFSLVCCLIYFISISNTTNQPEDFKTVSIINASLLFYFSFSFIFLTLLLKLINNQIWELHNIIESATKLLFTYAFWKLPKTYQ